MTTLFAGTTYRLFGKPVDSATAIGWLAAGVALWAVSRLICDRWDRSRITDYVMPVTAVPR
ncbi:MAG TPA: hypothetical protein VD994_15730 [Prosthecobacter sp.]|nr:hypothetical protein [Prosthecobacter sp.]